MFLLVRLEQEYSANRACRGWRPLALAAFPWPVPYGLRSSAIRCATVAKLPSNALIVPTAFTLSSTFSGTKSSSSNVRRTCGVNNSNVGVITFPSIGLSHLQQCVHRSRTAHQLCKRRAYCDYPIFREFSFFGDGASCDLTSFSCQTNPHRSR